MDTQHDELTTTIRSLLRNERQTRGLTIKQHAELMDISVPTYFRIQRGEIDKTSTALMRLVLNKYAGSLPAAV